MFHRDSTTIHTVKDYIDDFLARFSHPKAAQYRFGAPARLLACSLLHGVGPYQTRLSDRSTPRQKPHSPALFSVSAGSAAQLATRRLLFCREGHLRLGTHGPRIILPAAAPCSCREGTHRSVMAAPYPRRRWGGCRGCSE
ncbi:unnamed protein product [Pylaiella littoralis]